LRLFLDEGRVRINSLTVHCLDNLIKKGLYPPVCINDGYIIGFERSEKLRSGQALNQSVKNVM
jgi:hypothetical protein